MAICMSIGVAVGVTVSVTIGMAVGVAIALHMAIASRKAILSLQIELGKLLRLGLGLGRRVVRRGTIGSH